VNTQKRGCTVPPLSIPYPVVMRRLVVSIMLIGLLCAGCDKTNGAKEQEDKTQQRFDCAAANIAGASAGASTTLKC